MKSGKKKKKKEENKGTISCYFGILCNMKLVLQPQYLLVSSGLVVILEIQYVVSWSLEALLILFWTCNKIKKRKGRNMVIVGKIVYYEKWML